MKDATLRKWFLKFTNETGETPTHIVFGLDRWDDYWDSENWQELKLNELTAWDDVPDAALDREFDSGYGGNNSPNMCAWSPSWVIFSDNYDGAEALVWCPEILLSMTLSVPEVDEMNDDIVERLQRVGGPGGDLIALVCTDAAKEVVWLREQVALWKSAAQAFEMGLFDTGNLLIDRARGGSDFISETSHG